MVFRAVVEQALQGIPSTRNGNARIQKHHRRLCISDQRVIFVRNSLTAQRSKLRLHLADCEATTGKHQIPGTIRNKQHLP